MAHGPDLWVLADHRAGHRSQALGVAEATEQPFIVKDLSYSRIADFPGALLGRTFLGLTAASRRALVPPWPRAVIGAGRRSATVARAIKRESEGRTILLQIMVPRGMPLGDFDIVAAPLHDSPADMANIAPIVGAPHRITGTKLREAVEVWEETLANDAQPLIAVLLGGNTRKRVFTARMACDLGRRVNALALQSRGTVLVSTSPRTSPDAASAFIGELTAPRRIYRYGDEAPNPYLGYLALADFVIVTGDSVSMCCEACASPAPTYIYAPAGLIARRHAKLHQALFEGGYARPFGDRLEQWPHAPLNEAQRIAKNLLDRMEMQTPPAHA